MESWELLSHPRVTGHVTRAACRSTPRHAVNSPVKLLFTPVPTTQLLCPCQLHAPRHEQRRAPEWEHAGLVGPVIRGVVGDTIRVTVRNMLKSVDTNVSMHAHGVWYDKGSEGSPYADGNSE